MELLKAFNTEIASFDTSGVQLTKGQKMLLSLLSKHIESKKPIIRRDIVFLYCDVFFPSGFRTVNEYNWKTQKYESKKVVAKDYHNRTYYDNICMQWFKSNLGSCIIKGRLIAIPVIKLEDNL